MVLLLFVVVVIGVFVFFRGRPTCSLSFPPGSSPERLQYCCSSVNICSANVLTLEIQGVHDSRGSGVCDGRGPALRSRSYKTILLVEGCDLSCLILLSTYVRDSVAQSVNLCR